MWKQFHHLNDIRLNVIWHAQCNIPPSIQRRSGKGICKRRKAHYKNAGQQEQAELRWTTPSIVYKVDSNSVKAIKEIKNKNQGFDSYQ